MWTVRQRALIFSKRPTPPTTPPTNDAKGTKEPGDLCPPDPPEGRASSTTTNAAQTDAADVLDIEPPPSAAVPPCWGAYVSTVTRMLAQDGDPERLARALMALSDRPHRAAIAASMADRLRLLVKLDANGEISGQPRSSAGLADRARRAMIYAALLRTQRFGKSAATAATLFGKLATLRDVSGGYGSSAATVAVLRALLSSQLEGHGASRVHVHVAAKAGQPAIDRDIDVPAAGFVVVPLPANALDVSVQSAGPGLVARFERPVLRLWSRPPPPQASAIGLDVVWPADAAAGTTGTLRIMVRHDHEGARLIDTRIPLPPGVTLGAPTKGAAQVQGVLLVRDLVQPTGAVLEIPVRFGLAGKLTVPEATARVTRSPEAAATAPARPLVVR
jgi:hypothetical protein